MALSDVTIRAAKPREAQFKLFDEGGLFVIVKPSGGKLWRLKYRHLGKEQQLSLGTFPDVGLKDARRRRDEARRQVAAGLNPAFEKRRAAIVASVAATNTFAAVAAELIEKHEREGRAAPTLAKTRFLYGFSLQFKRNGERYNCSEAASSLAGLGGQIECVH